MIHSFSCKNFYSFAEDCSVSFVVNEKVPQNDGYLRTKSGHRLSKVITIIGANASGKTNLLKILPFLKWFIVDSFIRIKPDSEIPIKPFLFGKFKNKPLELSVEFEITGNIYKYTFILDVKKIFKEELRVKNKSKKKTTFKKVFLREWNDKNSKYDFSTGKGMDFPKDFESKLCKRKNASVIAIALQYGHELSEELNLYWQNVKTNVREDGRVDENVPAIFEALDFFVENKKLKQEAENLLSKFDLGFEELNIQKEKKENRLQIDVQAIHSFDNRKYPLSFQYESSGTKQFFVLLKTILQVLNNGGVAILDDFDAHLHPDIIVALFELFISPETNPKNAQILFSTHSHFILNNLDKNQIVLVEKNNKGISEAWRLDEMSGVRADDNYYAKYIAGAYGAIPKFQ